MGASIAVAAYLRGAEVHAVCGPGCPWLPAGISRRDVTGAEEMLDAARALWPKMHSGVFTAAVADFAPEPHGPGKFKKSEAPDGFSVHFRPNPDILNILAAERAPDQKIVAFAAETDDGLAEAVRGKLKSKGAHLMLGNRVGQDGAGFGASSNAIYAADVTGREEEWPPMPKTEIAGRVCSWLLSL
jgi:phosphopantothenoylcysteine decarboxylase/phosphopantothenate--cysteine ligase